MDKIITYMNSVWTQLEHKIKQSLRKSAIKVSYRAKKNILANVFSPTVAGWGSQVNPLGS